MSGTVPSYSAGDFARAFQDHLPTGPVWPRDPSSVQSQVCAALMQQYERLHARSANLLIDAFPVAPVELLPEWEETLGLPDPCAGPAPSLEVAQQQVAARFIASGGQSRGYFVRTAAALGYAITITEFAPYRAGRPCGLPDYGTAWVFAWQINALTFTIQQFQAGHDVAGDPLATWGNTVLRCEMLRTSPAHTTLLFSYSGGPPVLFDQAGNILTDEQGNPITSD